MSVFQLQDWWSTDLSNGSEEFDCGCMVIANLDNAIPPSEKIALGSQQGILRIYNPTRPEYHIEDLMLEMAMGQPILQLLCGMFIPSTDSLGLAVLHPRKLVVYELVAQAGKDGRVNYHSLNKCYDHDLGMDGKHFTAFNMVSGGFGGVRGREMILVQSLDGKLQIFEQSANAFTRQLVDCLLPGPLYYLPRLDAFVTSNYACTAECYRYQVLASSQADIGSRDYNNSKAGGAGPVIQTTGAFKLTAVRSALVEWSVNMGEPCRQIVEGNFSGSERASGSGKGPNSEMLMLCEKSLFLLKESGGIIQQKRLEKDPSCMCAFRPPIITGVVGPQVTNFMVAYNDCTIQVFHEFNLAWAAKVPCVPVQMAVGKFGGRPGLIVTVDDAGRLAISYLGTKPPTSAVAGGGLIGHAAVGATKNRELDYDKVDEEHRGLLQVIRDSQTEGKTEPKDKLIVRTQVSRQLDFEPIREMGNSTSGDDCQAIPADVSLVYLHPSQANQGGGAANAIKMCVRVYLSNVGDQGVSNVSIVATAPAFVHVFPKTAVIQSVAGSQSTPVMIKFYFLATRGCLPSSLEAQFHATYIAGPNSEYRVARATIALPLYMCCQPKPASKTAAYKIVLDTEGLPAVALTDLFDDYLFAAQESMGIDSQELLGNVAAQALGFQFWASASTVSGGNNSPALVSLLVSKNAGRYRVQSDSFPALQIIAQELDRRLHVKLTELLTANPQMRPNTKAPLITCADVVPLEDFFSVIDSHFAVRLKLQDKLSQLNDKSHQLRMIQKRLLVRYKDRTPTALMGLDLLLRETYNSLLTLGDSIEECLGQQRKLLVDLSSIAKFVVLVAGMKHGLSKQEVALLEASFCPEAVDGLEQGWEEAVDASMTYLLKTALAKVVKESATLAGNALEIATSTDGLKKHISMVFDRLNKGAKLAL